MFHSEKQFMLHGFGVVIAVTTLMISTSYIWLENSVKFGKSHDVNNALNAAIIPKSDHNEQEKTHICIVQYTMQYTPLMIFYTFETTLFYFHPST